MRVDTGQLAQHYASLPDEALFEIDRNDLTDEARTLYESELHARRVQAPQAEAPIHNEPEIEPDWMENAAAVCSYAVHPGLYVAKDIDQAREVLEGAGIACRVATRREGDQELMELMVPAAAQLRAYSVLDLEIFNPETEQEWKAHFADLSDADLLGINPKDLTAGLLDRAERLERVYAGERKRRGI